MIENRAQTVSPAGYVGGLRGGASSSCRRKWKFAAGDDGSGEGEFGANRCPGHGDLVFEFNQEGGLSLHQAGREFYLRVHPRLPFFIFRS